MKRKEVDAATEHEVVQQYVRATRRILFLDYDGTLVPLKRSPDEAIPNPKILDQVRRLAADSRNQLVIVSGRARQFLDHWFGDAGAVLVAEHGAFLRTPSGAWTSPVKLEPSWKALFSPVFNRYAHLCPGAFIEVKDYSLAWHYRNAEPGEAGRRRQELKDELQRLLLQGGRLQVLEGHQVIEIRQGGYDKGTSALQLINASMFDFILAVGDDQTDEDLFRALPAEAFTFKIGTRPTLARYTLPDPLAVRHLLALLGRA
jgi:trehalose 6-phosphate synthase/phosphatase